MKTYRINEIFRTIQGEGVNAGVRMTFVRFSRCNLKCWFCDTEFESGRDMEAIEILDEVRRLGCRNVLFTGGEPLLQLDDRLLETIQDLGGCRTFVETNGITTPKWSEKSPDFVTVSPKGPGILVPRIDELRIPVVSGMNIERYMKIHAETVFVSPVFNHPEETVNQKNLDYCLALLDEYPGLRLSVQVHKLIGVK